MIGDKYTEFEVSAGSRAQFFMYDGVNSTSVMFGDIKLYEEDAECIYYYQSVDDGILTTRTVNYKNMRFFTIEHDPVYFTVKKYEESLSDSPDSCGSTINYGNAMKPMPIRIRNQLLKLYNFDRNTAVRLFDDDEWLKELYVSELSNDLGKCIKSLRKTADDLFKINMQGIAKKDYLMDNGFISYKAVDVGLLISHVPVYSFMKNDSISYTSANILYKPAYFYAPMTPPMYATIKVTSIIKSYSVSIFYSPTLYYEFIYGENDIDVKQKQNNANILNSIITNLKLMIQYVKSFIKSIINKLCVMLNYGITVIEKQLLKRNDKLIVKGSDISNKNVELLNDTINSEKVQSAKVAHNIHDVEIQCCHSNKTIGITKY
ncbi:hypothetical protein [Candidatus Neoehrlichia procyonis]|uniref:hypothetical protein n=1 Tax=Candidatus Neoehrlichia procyonis TaxID=467750 RepID=UPI0018DE7482|nr:hypothetical protein [Candidatus Neoehrlichia lotoris]